MLDNVDNDTRKSWRTLFLSNNHDRIVDLNPLTQEPTTTNSNHHHSQWEMTSPMLSSPHYDVDDRSHLLSCDVKHLRHQRVRSQSLGSAMERFKQTSTYFSETPHPRTEDDDFEKWNKMPLPVFIKQGRLLLSKIPPPATESSKLDNSQCETNQNAVVTTPSISADDGEKLSETPIWISVMYGIINATIVLPVLMSFGSIIYQNEAFQPYINQLIKLTIISGMVHQICFSTFSTLPFAVGQVQDAGMIFLSSMAGDMVNYCRSRGYTDESLLATATVGLGICTAVLGCGLILIGKLQLAQYVQQLPTCVVGGYLAYIGWFCGISGLSIMTGAAKVTPAIVWNNIIFVLPGLGSGIMIYVMVRCLRHMAVLPTCILMLFSTFYVCLWLTGTTVEEATQAGWIRPSDSLSSFIHTWDYVKFDQVVWSALPRLVGTELSMIFVVALSSSLDVAAIELELNQPLNYNHELTTVGVSNVISGLSGGYTGSYIFSQSIFSLRAGIRSPLAGYVLACCQFIILIVPFPVLSYVPNFFYGALLSLIWVDLMYDWLWAVRSRMTFTEYILTLLTFASMHVMAVEWGILVGAGVYGICLLLGLPVRETNTEPAAIQPSKKFNGAKKGSDADCGILKSITGAPTNYGSLNPL